jgi:hypothetical protein
MGKLIAGVMSGVLAPLLIFALTRPDGPLNREDPPQLGGDIVDLDLSSASPCCIFSVGVEIDGFNGEPTVLNTSIIDAESGDALNSWDVLTFEPEADTDRARADAEVPIVDSGSYVVRFVLYDPDGVELDRAESNVIDVAA